METVNEKLAILDFGSQYTKLIARRVRELGVFCLIIPGTSSAEIVKSHKPKAIILSGGPNSVYDPGAPKIDDDIFSLGVPLLGICYGMQLIVQKYGGVVEKSKSREYGLTKLKVVKKSKLLTGLPGEFNCWMSHGDHATKLPPSFFVSAVSHNSICTIENDYDNIYGLQFHPEVSHTQKGEKILKNFLIGICGYKQSWSMTSFAKEEIINIQQKVGRHNVICALSGGVDSSVAAALVHQAVGQQLYCILIDTGLMRKNEIEQVLDSYKDMGMKIKVVKAKASFMEILKGKIDPEQKRKAIGQQFIKAFELEAQKTNNVKYLVQGTLYTDVIESIPVYGQSSVIKSHHNVGGLPDKMDLKLIEPLRELFKDEVRRLGSELGLPDKLIMRQPFPGPGLAVRIIGEVNERSVQLLQSIDYIVTSEIEKAKHIDKPWQYFAVLLPINSVGVMGDSRTYEKVIAIRAVNSSDGMTADWSKLPYYLLDRISGRIVSEVVGINRVVYDITSKPPGTIEWE